MKPCTNGVLLGECHLLLPISSKREKWYSSPPWLFYSHWPGIPHDTVTSFWPARALSSSGSDLGAGNIKCTAVLCHVHIIIGRQAIKAGLAVKPINRDKMNQPNPLLTFQGNHPLPFDSQPGTPFHLLYARQQQQVQWLVFSWKLGECYCNFSSRWDCCTVLWQFHISCV